MDTVRILIADDHELVRKGLTEVLMKAHPQWEIVGEACNGKEAIELGSTLRPDVAILDLAMPEANGLEVTTRLVKDVPGIKILLLTIHSAEPVMRQIRGAGASGFLAKNEAPQRLVEAVESVLAGAPFFASVSANRRASQLQERERVPVQYLLTPRELEVLRQLALGLSNKEIASALEMSVRTVETHRANIMTRLSVGSLGEMVKLAIHDGVV
jgi:DNA-binding NarL/FixJ family response regulator